MKFKKKVKTIFLLWWIISSISLWIAINVNNWWNTSTIKSTNKGIQQKAISKNINVRRKEIISLLNKLDNLLTKSYSKIISQYTQLFYFSWINNVPTSVKSKFENYNNLIVKIKKWQTDKKKRLMLDIVMAINKLAFEKEYNKINAMILKLKSTSKFKALCAYNLVKQWHYEERYKKASYSNKRKIKDELKNELFITCWKNNTAKYKLDNDKKIIKSEIFPDFKDMKIFPSKNIDISKQKEILDNKIDINNNPFMIKFASLVWIRDLNWRPDYHCWIDMTLSALNYDMYSNKAFIKWIRKSKTVTKNVKLLWEKLFPNKYKDILSDKIKWKYINYKQGNKLYLYLTPKFLSKYNCYMWINKSRYSNKIVWFWYFLLCQNKNGKNAMVIWHLDKRNLLYLLKQKDLTKINKGLERYKLWLLTGKWYQWNYYTFNNKTLKWDYPYEEVYYGMPNSHNEYYKIDSNKLKNGIILKYGTTWHSYWDHIHMSNMIIDNDQISMVTDNWYLEKVVQELFWTKKINFTKNHFFFLSDL